MRIKSFTTILLLIVGATMFGQGIGLAIAQEEADKAAEVSEVHVADADADGTVTTEELEEFLKNKYFRAWAQKVDADQDGKISNEEFLLTQKAHDELMGEGFAIALESERPKEKAQPKTAVEMMNKRFLDEKPLIGTTVEELYAYNEDGEEVDFEDLRGKHVVIVFGCLT